MPHSKRVFLTLLALVAAFVFGTIATNGVAAKKNGIEGVIPTTLTITENSELTGDVECLQTDNGPCIRFGAPGIKLRLNGFSMTGTANEPPRNNCIAGGDFGTQQADGIQSTFDRVEIEGPGLVQNMRRHGIALLGSAADPVERVVVEKLVSHQNCFSGIFMGVVNNSLVEEVVSARNSANSEARPCGGVCVTNSNNNRVRRSEFFGNGSTFAGGPPFGAPGGPAAPIPNDFGVGLVGSSSGNTIEENGIGGNINGLALFPLSATSTPTGNLIRKNVIVGNPPLEVSAANPGIDPVGADIRDFSAAGSNTFRDNLCITYTGPSPDPCQRLPRFSGHRNN
jgi:parallel beta helix pectate lyase-like protein